MKLKTPLDERTVRALKAGGQVQLTGTIVTARDAAHKRLVQGGRPPFSLNVIYHCGPIVKGGRVISAGPTTSMREEPYEADVIREYGVRAVIGKGGMGERTRTALMRHGCVYLAAVGGAGVLMADRIRRVKAVHMLEELGPTEAFWALEVEDLPLTVAMDAAGGSLYERVEEESLRRMKALFNEGAG